MRGIPELSIFNGLMQMLPASAFRFDYQNLGFWLIKRSIDTNTDQSVSDLKKYINSEKVPALSISVVTGLRVARPCIVDDTIKIVSWNELEPSPKKEMIERYLRNRYFPGIVNRLSCIINNFSFLKRHVAQEEVTKSIPLQIADQHEIIHCAGLLGPSSPTIMTNFISFPEWMPISGYDYGPFFANEIPSQNEWPETACEDFPKLYKKYIALPSSTKLKIKIPLHRLNSAMQNQNIVDQVIDLGIALEALFLFDLDKKDHGEIGFKLRVRGARYLKTSFDDRKRVYHLISTLYEIRSQAVHSGSVAEKTNKPTGILIKEGFTLIAEALMKIINAGALPDWDQIILS